MSICLLDTSVFCNIVGVPGRDDEREQVVEELGRLVEEEWSLLLPIPSIYETGNHIAQAAHGRFETAARFVDQVQEAFGGNAPWVPTPFPSGTEILRWIDEFPECAAREVSFADLSIIKIFERECERHRARRVRIWSFDGDLQGYDRVP